MAPIQGDLSENGCSTDATSPVSRSTQCRLSTYNTFGIDIDVDGKYNVLPFTAWMNVLKVHVLKVHVITTPCLHLAEAEELY
jgi:hypothetical protein